MPAEWSPHAATLIAWPTHTRAALWGALMESAMLEYSAVANAIAAFEPVIMVVDPDQAGEARRRCSARVEILPIPIDDSWMCDSGPIFVTDGRGGVALVHFGFNAWGGKSSPYDRDARMPERLASHLGMRRYRAPFVLEGGSIFVDGEGTVLTTEQCLLHPNRNPNLSRAAIEQGLRDYLGAEVVVWLGQGHSTDRDTDGHIDGIAQYVAPAVVLLLAPDDPRDPDHRPGRENHDRLRSARDARGRAFQVISFQPGPAEAVAQLNVYLPNGAVIVPVVGTPDDEGHVAQIRAAFPGRELVPVLGRTLLEGGGGPHCITQQIPVGHPVP